MESYQEFMNRIGSFEVPKFEIDAHSFVPSNAVKQKISLDRDFKPFYGDTVVFDLSDREKREIFDFVNMLYDRAPNCFSKKFDKSTMHLTLHDLSSSPDAESVSSQTASNLSKINSILKRERIPNDSIRMHSNYIVNMLSTSLVMCFYPIDEREYEKLMHLYMLMDEVVSLPYRCTPHVTLAYFNPNGFDEESAKRLTDCVNFLNEDSLDILLTTDRLIYQRFSSMNYYMNFLKLVE